MQSYTIQIPADIYFEIDAETEDAALALAKKTRDKMTESNEFASDGDALNSRVYAHQNGEPSIEDIA